MTEQLRDQLNLARLTEITRNLERDRREPDKVLCCVQSLRRLVLDETPADPWNPDRPDLSREGVNAAADALYTRDLFEYEGFAPMKMTDQIHFEYEEEAVRIIRAYAGASMAFVEQQNGGES